MNDYIEMSVDHMTHLMASRGAGRPIQKKMKDDYNQERDWVDKEDTDFFFSPQYWYRLKPQLVVTMDYGNDYSAFISFYPTREEADFRRDDNYRRALWERTYHNGVPGFMKKIG